MFSEQEWDFGHVGWGVFETRHSDRWDFPGQAEHRVCWTSAFWEQTEQKLQIPHRPQPATQLLPHPALCWKGETINRFPIFQTYSSSNSFSFLLFLILALHTRPWKPCMTCSQYSFYIKCCTLSLWNKDMIALCCVTHPVIYGVNSELWTFHSILLLNCEDLLFDNVDRHLLLQVK